MSGARAPAPWDPDKIVCPGCGLLVGGLEPVVLAGAGGRSERARLCIACVAALPREEASATARKPPYGAGPPGGGPHRGGPSCDEDPWR